jgi:hypothetical protein
LVCTALLLQACGGGGGGGGSGSNSSSSSAATAAAPDRVRGTVESLKGQVLTVATSTGAVRVQLAPSTPVANVVKTDRAHIADGSFLGIGSVTGPDGSQRAAEVTVFPESMRGTGEGSYPWNHPAVSGGGTMTNGTASASTMTNGTVSRSASTMTNGTVSKSASTMTNGTVSASRATNDSIGSPAGAASALTLTYKDGSSRGSQTITIPPDVPIVALEPGTPKDLKAGVHVLVFASRSPDGALTAARVLAGKNGLVPPQ